MRLYKLPVLFNAKETSTLILKIKCVQVCAFTVIHISFSLQSVVTFLQPKKKTVN